MTVPARHTAARHPAARRSAALLLALCATGGGLAATPAHAATVSATVSSTPISSVAPSATVTTPPDGTKTVSLEIHALKESGSQIVPVEGVRFSLRKVTTVDLTTDAGLAAAATYLQPGQTVTPQIEAQLAPSVPLAQTDAEGNVTASRLPVGLYVLQANGWVDTFLSLPTLVAKNDVDPEATTTPAGPDAVWQYDLISYPKHVPVEPQGEPIVEPTPSGGAGPAGPSGANGASGPAGNAGPAGPTGAAAASGPVGALGDTIARGLAYTGAELMGPLGVALASVLAGIGLLVVARRRRREQEEPTTR